MNIYPRPLEAFTNHFRDEMYKLLVDSQDKTIAFTVASACALYPCTIAISPDDSKFTIKLTMPLIVTDPAMQEQISEVLWRANKNIVGGRASVYSCPKT